MTRFLIALCLAALAALAPAQAQQDDRSRLIRFLEDTLSDGAARQVRIEGFAGALSSTATLERLTIADAGGVWLTVEGAELTWRRAGLLAGEVDISRLAAERIVLARLPETAPAATTPEATPFALPDLPVSIRIADLEAGRIELGAPLLGVEVAASVTGSLMLAEGQGSAALDLIRRDGPRGVFALAASYANDTRQLALDLELAEDPGGITVSVLGIPDAPAVELAIAGSGPLDDFASTITLATDGDPRITGEVILARADTGDQRLSVDLSGDVARLLLPEYQPFFGDAVALTAEALRAPGGAMVLERFDLSTASLSVRGSGALGPGGVPERFSLSAALRPNDGVETVRLPVPGQVVTAAGADLRLSYDRAAGDSWAGRADLAGLRVDDLSLEQVGLTLSGSILAPENVLTRVTGRVAASFQGLALPDAAMRAAVGRAGDAAFAFDWQPGAPLTIADLTLAAETAELRGAGQIAAAENALRLTTEIQATVPDLAAFSDLAGSDLAGAVTVEIVGEVELLSGAFDLDLATDGQGLSLGMGEPAGLLAGQTRATARMVRDAGGLRLEDFDIAGREIEATGSASLSSATSRLQVTARLRDAGLFGGSLSGPVSAEASMTRAAASQPWDLTAEARLQGVAVVAEGQVGLPDGAVDLALSGTAALALVNPFIAPRSVRGTADLNLRLAGPPGLSALSGRIEARDLRIVAPNAGLAIEDASAMVALTEGRADITGQGSLATGGGVTLSGGLDLGAPGMPGRFEIGLANARIAQGDLFQTVVERGDITLTGQMTAGPSVSGRITLGQTDFLIEPTGFGAAEPIPEITHIGESAAQYATRVNAGLLADSSASGPPLPLDLTVTAGNRIFLRGSGLDAELGGVIRLGGTSADVIPSGRFDLIRGRLSLLGQRFDLNEASVTLSGSFDPFLRVVGQTRAGDTVVFLTLEGPARAPELTLSSQPDLPEDEILSRLLFGRSAATLSPVQALQLVDGLSRLAGSGSLIGGLRETLGIDDLDIATDPEGNAQLRLGRYIGEHAYTDIGIGSDGAADLSLNLDLTPNLTARGSFGSDGQGGLGIFFERDY